MLHRIWNGFLRRHRRWLGDPGGNLRVYDDPLCDRHVEYHIEEVDGWLREWYAYVPEIVRQHPEVPVPLVFACNGAIYMENSGWNRIADENGFVVVYPTAGYGQMCVENAYYSSDNLPLPAWNIFHKDTQPEEYPFFRYLITRTAADYPIDRSRIFVTGHSLGSLMVQMLGLTMPEYFATIAPCSGILFSDLEQEPLSLPEVASRKDTLLPVWMFGGSEEAFLVPDRPADGNRTAYTLEAWRRLNHIEPTHVQDWTAGWCPHETRWNDLIYRKDGIPPVGFTRVQDMPHATTIEMSRRIWDEFFSRFSRVDGSIVYQGKMENRYPHTSDQYHSKRRWSENWQRSGHCGIRRSAHNVRLQRHGGSADCRRGKLYPHYLHRCADCNLSDPHCARLEVQAGQAVPANPEGPGGAQAQQGICKLILNTPFTFSSPSKALPGHANGRVVLLCRQEY